MSYNTSDIAGLRARIAKRTVEEEVNVSIDKLGRLLPPGFSGGLEPTQPAPGFEDLTPEKLRAPPTSVCKSLNINVGIVGGGMAGLYTAMILKDLEISYEVLERSKDCGGRVWTHYFSDPKKEGDYYDVGAMRFPEIPIMRRTWKLFEELGIEKDTTESPAQETLIPYYFTGPRNPFYYNDILEVAEKPGEDPHEAKFDPFKVSVSKGGLVPDSFVVKGYKNILKEIFDDWKDGFATDFEQTWRDLMSQDARSVTVRSYMIDKLSSEKYKPRDIDYVANWCETMDAATNHYDSSFTSLLLHSLEFDYPLHPASNYDPSGTNADPKKNIWWCLNGGSSVLTDRMLKKIDITNVLVNHRVTAMKIDRSGSAKTHSMAVTVETPTETETKNYSYVITTCTTPALQTMDLREAELKYSHREAIRILRYDNSVKVGIKFKYRWWADDKKIIRGGLGKTDRPTRVIVYPSYALNTPCGDEGVLLACYNWAQDAARLGTYSDEEIVSLVIADLAIMHDMTESDLRNAMDCYHVHDWNRDARTGGAFGLFGPGQFATLFPKIQRPTADDRLIFAGELTSIYHGWIVASLNSSFRAVHQMLLAQYLKSPTEEEKDYIVSLIHKLYQNWGGDDHEPAEVAEYDTDPQGTAGWQVFLASREEDV